MQAPENNDPKYSPLQISSKPTSCYVYISPITAKAKKFLFPVIDSDKLHCCSITLKQTMGITSFYLPYSEKLVSYMNLTIIHFGIEVLNSK